MSVSIKMVVVLTMVGLLSGGSLTFVYQATAPAVEARRLESLRKAIFIVLPEAADYREIRLGDDIVYQGLDKYAKKAGLAFLAEGSGFQGKIRMMIGVNQDLSRLRNIRILENVETPGLGGKIVENDFQQQFEGLPIDEDIRLNRKRTTGQTGTSAVQAITGATISSRAVVDSINRRIFAIEKMMK